MSGTGAVLAWTVAGFQAAAGNWPMFVCLLLGGLLSAGAAAFFRVSLSKEHHEAIEAIRQRDVEHEQLKGLKSELETEALAFERRRQKFEDRLMTYHEWLEFPNMEEISKAEEVNDEIDARDKEVLALVQEAADSIFEGFRKDRYSKDGQFVPRLLTDEVLLFVTDIARVYQPDAKEPLLETSVEKLLKSLNHISLQLLFQLEQLPLNVKDYSLAKAYEHIRTGARVYDAYKSVSPYLPYASYTWNLGRMVLGFANPVLTGTWMLGSEIVRRTGQKISQQYIDRYSLKLTGEAIRIIANETAMTFDENFRYRDPNWVYGLELTEMVYQFPLSRETLQQALCEIGNLPLRNSYDRVFLYRCLASGRSPKPQTFVKQEALTAEQRRQIVERLERFFRHHVHGRRHDRVAAWSAGASERLGMPLKVLDGGSQTVSERDLGSALASLGAFLSAVKEMPPPEMREKLLECQVSAEFAPELRDEVIDDLVERPPMFFDFPDLDPENPLVPVYFEDLMRLETEVRPEDLQGLWAIREAAEYFRRDRPALEGQLFKAYAERLGRLLDPESPEQTLHPQLIMALPRILDREEFPSFIYAKIGAEDESEPSALASIRLPGLGNSKIHRWLVGSEKRLIVVEVREGLELDDYNRFQILWTLAEDDPLLEDVTLDRSKTLMKTQVVIRGGRWLTSNRRSSEKSLIGLRIQGDKLKGYESHFGPLLRWFEKKNVEV
tara:strand:- start:8685 stop:10853 length:2169 start_codon:yes stop_codon:yes gene_type:complete